MQPAPIPDIIIEEGGRLNNIITDFLEFCPATATGFCSLPDRRGAGKKP